MSKEEKFEQTYQEIVKEYDSIMESSRAEAKNENRWNILILVIIILIEIFLCVVIFELTGVFSFEIISLLFTVTGVIFAAIKHRGGKSKIEKYANEFKEKSYRSNGKNI